VPNYAVFLVTAATFSYFPPLLRRFLAHFAPVRPLWAQLSPHHVQITQGKQHIELRIILGQSLVARLLVLEDVFDDMC